jgi:hypothetical protein
MRIVLIAALFSLPTVAAATTQTLAAGNYGPSATGGGSTGYNHSSAIDYRLKKHHHGVKGRVSMKPHSWVKQKEKKSSQ